MKPGKMISLPGCSSLWPPSMAPVWITFWVLPPAESPTPQKKTRKSRPKWAAFVYAFYQNCTRPLPAVVCRSRSTHGKQRIKPGRVWVQRHAGRRYAANFTKVILPSPSREKSRVTVSWVPSTFTVTFTFSLPEDSSSCRSSSSIFSTRTGTPFTR